MPTYAIVAAIIGIWILAGLCLPSGGYGSFRDVVYTSIGFILAIAFTVSFLLTRGF
jgi:hypothetical protein